MLIESSRDGYEEMYEFADGAKLHVTLTGDYLLEDQEGEIIVEGDDLRPSPLTRDCLDVAASVANFIYHDAELYEYSVQGSWGSQHPSSSCSYEVDVEELIFDLNVAAWGDAHSMELSDLSVADEDRS